MKCMKCEEVELKENCPYFVSFEENGESVVCYASQCPECGTYYMSNDQLSLYRRKVMESRIKSYKILNEF